MITKAARIPQKSAGSELDDGVGRVVDGTAVTVVAAPAGTADSEMSTAGPTELGPLPSASGMLSVEPGWASTDPRLSDRMIARDLPPFRAAPG